jgi:Gram-negative bacterial TonB protein C-terminal
VSLRLSASVRASFLLPALGLTQGCVPPGARVLVLSNPPGARVATGHDTVGTSPVAVYRRPSVWPGLESEMFITVVARDSTQCSQHRLLAVDEPTPDTVLLDLHRCPNDDQDYTRVFALEEVDQKPAIISRYAQPLTYPSELRAKSIEGCVLAEAIIDSTGHPDPDSFRALFASDARFWPNVRSFLSATTYKPAIYRTHRVRVRVAMPFSFRLKPRQLGPNGSALCLGIQPFTTNDQ